MKDGLKSSKEKSHSDQESGMTLVLENFPNDLANALMNEPTGREGMTLMHLLKTVMASLRRTDLQKTRLVITGDLIASVNSRENRTAKPFTLERGAGVVAAKTMPPDPNGIVDLLIPSYYLYPDEDESQSLLKEEYIQHLAAHEAVHVALFHNGNQPFDLHRREKLDYAARNFASMASEQIEEHLAEFLATRTTGRPSPQNADQVSSAIAAWEKTLASELPAIPENAPDYMERGIMVSFEGLHILWKSLAYLAAALRTKNGFEPVPKDISDLPQWASLVAEWWPRYLQLMQEIPMELDVDIESTDKVVGEMALHLQEWANGIGFDFRDNADGTAFFRIKIWD